MVCNKWNSDYIGDAFVLSNIKILIYIYIGD